MNQNKKSSHSEKPQAPTLTEQPLASSSQPSKKQVSIQGITQSVLCLCMGLFVFYLVADRFIPNTDMARVRSHVIPVTPLVSGSIIDVLVKPNDVVEAGDALIRIDPSNYEIALKEAEQGLKRAGKQIGVQTASVAVAQAKLSDALAHQENVRSQSSRVLAMVDKGIVTKADADKTRASLASAKAQVASASANLDQAKEQLGQTGSDNIDIQSALLALQKAQLNVERTVVRAPAFGGVSNFRLDEGYYAREGQPLLTFVSGEDIWLEAYFRENSLGNVQAGNNVEVALDYAPGDVFKGQVISIDYGVNWGESNQAGQLASVGAQTGWLRQTQRFPVMIRFDNESAKGLLRVGGQADVMVYTKEQSIMNIFGRVWIRLLSWMSYVR